MKVSFCGEGFLINSETKSILFMSEIWDTNFVALVKNIWGI